MMMRDSSAVAVSQNASHSAPVPAPMVKMRPPSLRRIQSEARLGAPKSSLAAVYSFGMSACLELTMFLVELLSLNHGFFWTKWWLHVPIRALAFLVTVVGVVAGIAGRARKNVIIGLWIAVLLLSNVFYGLWLEHAQRASASETVSLFRQAFAAHSIVLWIVMSIVSGIRQISGLLIAAFGLAGFLLAAGLTGLYSNKEYTFSDTGNMISTMGIFVVMAVYQHRHSRNLTIQGHKRWRLLQSQAKYTMDLSRRILPSVVMDQVDEIELRDRDQDRYRDHFAFQSESCGIVFIQVSFGGGLANGLGLAGAAAIAKAKSESKSPIAVPPERFKQLSDVYDKLDKISEAYNAYTVERLHDTYFAVTGLDGSGADDIPTPRSTSDNAASTGNMNMNRRGSEITRLESAIQVACGALAVAKLLPSEWGCRIRVGVHAGPVQACVIGNLDNPHFTALGDAVNVGARLMTTCEWGRIQLSADTVALMPDRLHSFEERGAIQVKGVGAIDSFWYRDDPEASASSVAATTLVPTSEPSLPAPRLLPLNELELGNFGPDFQPESFNMFRALRPVRGGLLYRFNDKSVEKEFLTQYTISGASTTIFVLIFGFFFTAGVNVVFLRAGDSLYTYLSVMSGPLELIVWISVLLLRPVRRSVRALTIANCCGYAGHQLCKLWLTATLVNIQQLRHPDDVALSLAMGGFIIVLFFFRMVPPLNVAVTFVATVIDVLFTILYFGDGYAAAFRGVVFFIVIAVGFYGNLLLEDAHRRAFWVDYSLRENVKKSIKLLRMSLPDVAVNAVLTKEFGTFLDLGWLGLGGSNTPLPLGSSGLKGKDSATGASAGMGMGHESIGLVPLSIERSPSQFKRTMSPRVSPSASPLRHSLTTEGAADPESGAGATFGLGTDVNIMSTTARASIDSGARQSSGSLEGDSYKSEVLHLVQCDIVDFTRMSRLLSVQDIARVVNTLFSEFDGIVSRERAHKLQTAGDSYLVASSLRFRKATYGALQAVQIALAMTGTLPGVIATLKSQFGIDVDLRVRVGVATGEGHGGIVGSLKPTFLFFGPVVSLVNTMERSAPPNQVLVCSRTVGILHHNTEIPHVLRIIRSPLQGNADPDADVGDDVDAHADADASFDELTVSPVPAKSMPMPRLSLSPAMVPPRLQLDPVPALGSGSGTTSVRLSRLSLGALNPLSPLANARRASVEYLKRLPSSSDADDVTSDVQVETLRLGLDGGRGTGRAYVTRNRSQSHDRIRSLLGYVVSHAPGSTKMLEAVERIREY